MAVRKASTPSRSRGQLHRGPGHPEGSPLRSPERATYPLQDESFDLGFSEYGAAIWCDPYVWIPEARRLLRPGGRLVFLCNSVLAMLCAPAADEPVGEALLRAQFGLHRIEFEDQGAPEFHLSHADMFGLLAETGFAVEALHELRAPEGQDDELRYYVDRGWARRWPSEEVWVTRRVADAA